VRALGRHRLKVEYSGTYESGGTANTAEGVYRKKSRSRPRFTD
jgi:hypothetical protein